MIASFLEGLERRGKPHDHVPRGRGVCIFATRERGARAARNHELLDFLLDFEATRFGANLDLLRGTKFLGDDIAVRETEAPTCGHRSRESSRNLLIQHGRFSPQSGEMRLEIKAA
jgi:hypothetical protein